MLKFEIVSSRTVEAGSEVGVGRGAGSENRYVAYMLQVRRDSAVNDPNPANVERRYTHFQLLYEKLRKEFPALLSGLSFPKKAYLGNFGAELISSRSTGFEALLELVAGESRLRESPAAVSFFQDVEREQARRFTSMGWHDRALTVLETSFKLLNKVYTDVSHPVLCTLCRAVATACASGGATAGQAEHCASLALRRYQLVSDADLLLLYAPLLHACIDIWERLGRDKSQLEEELAGLRRRGMKVDPVPLGDAVDALENL